MNETCKCGHERSSHASGQWRTRWICDWPGCECEDFESMPYREISEERERAIKEEIEKLLPSNDLPQDDY